MSLKITSNHGPKVVEGTISGAESGPGTTLTFTISGLNAKIDHAWVEIISIGESGEPDFWIDDRPVRLPLTHLVGSMQPTFQIALNADRTVEDDKSYTVLLYENPTDFYTGVKPIGSTTFTIIDDDLMGTAGHDRVLGTARADYIDGLAGNDTLLAGDGNDTIFGGSGNDSMLGGRGDDTLVGGTGNDTMIGGEGHDRYYLAGKDVIIEAAGGGIDWVYTAQTATLGQNLENLRLVGQTALNGIGNGLNNVINGNDQINVLRGEGGNDTLNGGGGRDYLVGGEGQDQMFGTDDKTRDYFQFNFSGELGKGGTRDRIDGFERGYDVIDLHGLDANRAVAGNQVFRFGGETAAKNSVWFTDTGRDLIVSGDYTGDGRADFEILVTREEGLGKADFIL